MDENVRTDTAEDLKEKHAKGKGYPRAVAWALGNYFTADDKNLKNEETRGKKWRVKRRRKGERKKEGDIRKEPAKWRERK